MSLCTCQEAKPGQLIPVKRVRKSFFCVKCLREVTGKERPMGQDAGMDAVTTLESLHEAEKIVCGVRQDDYGAPEASFRKIAALWSVYLTDRLQHTLTAKDVASMMILVKLARGQGKRDNWVDIIGYAAIGADRL